MVNINAFVSAVQNLTGDAASKELAQFCRKWLDENVDKVTIAEADRLLAMFNAQTHTLGLICVLHIKLNKLRNDSELWEFLTHLYEQLPQFDAKQIGWAPDLYDRFFECVADQLLAKKAPLWGILLLERAILTCSYGRPDRLSNLHSVFFCLCLKAKHFDRALPFLRVDVVELFKRADGGSSGGAGGIEIGGGGMTTMMMDGDKVSSSENLSQQTQSSSTGSSTAVGIASSAAALFHKAVSTVSSGLGMKMDEPKQTQPFLKRRSVLLYFYYGGMIFAALELWEDAALFLEHAICLPMMKKNSLIVLEALKKYNIIWLIMGRRKPMDSLPRYRSSIIQRSFVSLASVYVRLWSIIQRSGEANVVRALNTYLEEKHAIFARDGNIGLMKVLIQVCRENSIKRLGNIFVSLQLNDVSRLAHLPAVSANDESQESVEQIIFRLRQNGQFAARIDGRTQTVVFEEAEGEGAKGGKLKRAESADREVDSAMTELMQLASIIRTFEHAVRLNPHYIEKSTAQKEKAMGTGGNGGGGHSSSLMFADDDQMFSGSP